MHSTNPNFTPALLHLPSSFKKSGIQLKNSDSLNISAGQIDQSPRFTTMNNKKFTPSGVIPISSDGKPFRTSKKSNFQ